MSQLLGLVLEGQLVLLFMVVTLNPLSLYPLCYYHEDFDMKSQCRLPS
jgi:hypothetical protein